jgi:hypothetical protein
MDLIKEIDTRELMYDIIPKGGTGAELGVCRGGNAVQLIFRTKPSVLFLVDPWEKAKYDRPPHDDPNLWYDDYFDSVTEIFNEEIKQGKVILHKQYATSFLASLPDNFLDWVYIDSNHHYQNVSREIDLSIKKVKSGGHIMGHDYLTNPQVWATSIIRAVNERIQNGDMKMEAITNEKWPSYLTRVL